MPAERLPAERHPGAGRTGSAAPPPGYCHRRQASPLHVTRRHGNGRRPYARGVTAAPPVPAGPRVRARRPWLPRILVTNLVLEVMIVVTGGLVRLTGSGLGCPSWPQCVPGSYVPVCEQAEGWHQYIEFGNRTLTGAVGLAAVAVLSAVWRWGDRRRELVVPAVVVFGGVALQAVLGGITVRTGLDPLTVAAHFLVSMALVA